MSSKDHKLLSPYPGLRPFTENESSIFFGRKEQVDEILHKLKRKFVAILGPSGCGKSSLISAGVLAALQKGYLYKEGTFWSIIKTTPGNQPFAQVAQELLHDKYFRKAWNASDDENMQLYEQSLLRADLSKGAKSLCEIIDINPLDNKAKLLIVIDQFEELIRFSQKHEDDAANFVNFLLESSQHKNIYVMIGMRTDYLGETSQFSGLAEAINQGLFLTPRLSRNQLYEAITKPALCFNGKVEEYLAIYLLNEASSNPDKLPLLQHSLMRHWEGDEDKVLTYKEHIDLGGLDSCLDKHLEEAWKELDHYQRNKAEIIFKALIQSSEKRGFLRRPIKLSELIKITETNKEKISKILSVFKSKNRNFLVQIKTSNKKQINQEIIDISHESLIRQWSKLNIWANQEAEKEEIYRRVQNKTYLYLKGEAELWHGADLLVAREWLKKTKANQLWSERYPMRFLPNSKNKNTDSKNPTFKDIEYFIEKSIKKEELKTLEKEKIQKNEIVHLYKSIVIISVILMILFLLLVFTYNILQETKTLKLESEKSNLELKSLNIKLKEANKNTNKSKKSLYKSIKSKQKVLFDSYLSNASLNAKLGQYKQSLFLLNKSKELEKTEKKSNSLLINNTRINARNLLMGFVTIMGGKNSGDILLEQKGYHFNTLSLSENNEWLLAGGDDGILQLKHLLSGRKFTTNKKLNKKITSVVFHPNKKWFYTAGEDHLIDQWDYSSFDKDKFKKIKSLKTKNKITSSMAIIPSKNILVTGSGYNGGKKRSIKFINLNTDKETPKLRGHNDIISDRGLAVSLDEKYLVSASLDDEVRVWNIKKLDKKSYRIFKGYHSNPTGLAISKNSNFLAIGEKNQIDIRHIKRRRSLGRFNGHQNTVFDLEFYQYQFSSKKIMLASASRDKTIRLWDVNSGVTVRILEGHQEDVIALEIDEKSRIIYSASYDGTIREWSLNLPNQWDIHTSGRATSSAITSDGHFIFVGLESGEIKSYNIFDKNIIEVKNSNKKQTIPIKKIFLDKKGEKLFSLDIENNIASWSVKNGKISKYIKYLVPNGKIKSINLFHDNKSLIILYENNRIIILDINTRTIGKPIIPHKDGVATIGLNFLGNIVLTSGKFDKKIKHWKIENKQLIQLSDDISIDEKIRFLAISKNNKKIVTLGKDLIVKVRSHPVKDIHTYKSLNGHQNKIYQAIFSPDGHQLATLGKDRTVRVWDLTTNTELFKIDLPLNSDAEFSQFNFDCTKTGCWIAVPYLNKKTKSGFLLYNLGKINYD